MIQCLPCNLTMRQSHRRDPNITGCECVSFLYARTQNNHLNKRQGVQMQTKPKHSFAHSRTRSNNNIEHLFMVAYLKIIHDRI